MMAKSLDTGLFHRDRRNTHKPDTRLERGQPDTQLIGQNEKSKGMCLIHHKRSTTQGTGAAKGLRHQAESLEGALQGG